MMQLFASFKWVPLLLATLSVCAIADDTSTNDVVNVPSDQIAKLRKFRAENQYITTEDGYIINVVHIFPVREAPNKRPVIFNHGTSQSSTYFMVNSVDARPRDYSQLDAGSMSQDELEVLLAKDPTSKCLPLLLACCGHHVYLVNRRGTDYSLGKVDKQRAKRDTSVNSTSAHNPLETLGGRWRGITDDLLGHFGIGGADRDSPSDSSGLLGFLRILLRPQLNLGSIFRTLDRSFWRFSFDEQARFDLPAVIRHVLRETGSEKVAYVGHSFGSVLMFMLQSEEPEWADKVEPFLAWSPDIYLGNSTSAVVPLLSPLQPILENSLMPFPPTPVTPLTRTLLASLCQTKLAQDTVCRKLEDAMWGPSEGRQETLPAFVATQFYSVSAHEAAHVLQIAEKGRVHKFDFGKAGNLKVYGQAEPPRYDVSRIRSESISLWHGGRDILASPKDVKQFIQDLSVQVDDRFITQVPFNHYCLLFDRNVSILVNLPSLKLIESYTR